MGAVIAAVGGDDIWSAEYDVFAIDGGGSMRQGRSVRIAIWSIAPGIGRAKESHNGRAESDCEMKRASVTADHTNSMVQKAHERAKLAVEKQRIGVLACGANLGGKIVLAGPVINDATKG